MSTGEPYLVVRFFKRKEGYGQYVVVERSTRKAMSNFYTYRGNAVRKAAKLNRQAAENRVAL